MRKILALFILFFVLGCEYRPISKITHNVLPQNIYVDVLMSKTDPQNTVAIKDAVKKGIVERLGREFSDKKAADSYIIVNIKSLRFTELTYDQFGYVTSYRANLRLNFKTKLSDGEIFSTDTVGDYDFRVSKLVKNVRDANSVISDKDRYNAIENASKQAFDEFISALAVRGLKN